MTNSYPGPQAGPKGPAGPGIGGYQFGTLAAAYQPTLTGTYSCGPQLSTTMAAVATTRIRACLVLPVQISLPTNANNWGWTIYRSTVGVPAQGAAVGGGDTAVGTSLNQALYANPTSPNTTCDFYGNIVVLGVDIGLTTNATYYYYVAVFLPQNGLVTMNAGLLETFSV